MGRRKGVLEGFVERLLLAPALIAIAIVLIRFAFRIGNHFGFSDGADEDLQGYDANFGAYGCRTTYSRRHIHRRFSHHWRRLEANALAQAPEFPSERPVPPDFCTFSKAHAPIWRTRSRE